MDKNKELEKLTKLCDGVKAIHPILDVSLFRFYVSQMFVAYCQSKEFNATPLDIKKGFVSLPGNGDQVVATCLYISAQFFECPISYQDLYSISHVDRDSIRKCERDIRDVLSL